MSKVQELTQALLDLLTACYAGSKGPPLYWNVHLVQGFCSPAPWNGHQATKVWSVEVRSCFNGSVWVGIDGIDEEGDGHAYTPERALEMALAAVRAEVQVEQEAMAQRHAAEAREMADKLAKVGP